MMSGWLSRLKTEIAPDTSATEPTKPTQGREIAGFVGFVAWPRGRLQKNRADESAVTKLGPQAVNQSAIREIEPAIDPGQRFGLTAPDMSPHEINTNMTRLALLTDRGVKSDDAELVAHKLSIRDREQDDRRLCLECVHLRGMGHWRCANGAVAGVAVRAIDTQLSSDWVRQFQRCDGFSEAKR